MQWFDFGAQRDRRDVDPHRLTSGPQWRTGQQNWPGMLGNAYWKDLVMPLTVISAQRRHRGIGQAGGWWTWAAVAVAVVVMAACSSNSGDAGSASKAGVVHVPANFCGLLSGADISRVMGRAFPAPQGTQSGSEAQCDAVPTAGNDVSFKLYWNNLYCQDGQRADEQCLNSQAKGFATNKQTAGQVQNIPGLGDQAFCSWRRPRRSTCSAAGSI